jgi:oligosaccharide reducing-end xylanase
LRTTRRSSLHFDQLTGRTEGRPLCRPVRFALACFFAAVSLHATPAPRNLFTELLGKSHEEVSAKIENAHRQLFHGRDTDQRVYFPVGDDMAYIADIGNGDVRSEGMSYGMMIAAQMNRREEFDRLWKWAKTHMYHASGPRRGYFAWQCAFDGKQMDPGSASDGEEWFATALFFAAHRWSSASPGSIDYAAEAQSLLREMLNRDRSDGITALFDHKEKQVVFAPTREASTFTDPSYHLPAFTALWAKWAVDENDRRFWHEVTETSRKFFHRAAHSKTGLMPEYAHFNGAPYQENTFGPGKGDFRFDAWRTLSNVAVDHAWFNADPWQVEQSNRVLTFLATHSRNFPNQFALDGRPLSNESSIGLVAMAAVAGLAADPDLARPFVQRLWEADTPSGKWRYYDGLLYHLALLQVSGRFQIIFPR